MPRSEWTPRAFAEYLVASLNARLQYRPAFDSVRNWQVNDHLVNRPSVRCGIASFIESHPLLAAQRRLRMVHQNWSELVGIDEAWERSHSRKDVPDG
jgi:hypothetical protein